MAKDNDKISALNDQIRALDKEISRDKAITMGVCGAFPVLCPAVKALSDLISQREAKIRCVSALPFRSIFFALVVASHS